jgi:anaerobic magnesium-protoporphyrin IX monomethyl ester cyclase
MTVDVLVIAPFRRPTFRKAITSSYPTSEPWDSAPVSVAAALLDGGYSVDYLALQNIFDAWEGSHDLPGLTQLLTESPARVVLFSSDAFIASRSTATLFGMRIVADALRRRGSAAAIGVTGRLATTAGRHLLETLPACDFVVHGEPETVIAQVIADVLDQGTEALAHPSVSTRRSLAAGAVPVAAMSPALDAVPLPAWRLIERSVQIHDRVRGDHRIGRLPVSVRTSAGCKFSCRFCAGVPNWKNYRMKSAGRVGAELDQILDLAGGRARVAFLEDEIFTRDARHVNAVAQEFTARGVTVDGAYTHSSLLTRDIASRMRTMARMVFFGLDSPDDQVLRDMRKGQLLGTVLEAVGVAADVGLPAHLEWIIGSPPETVDTLITSLHAIATLLGSGGVAGVNTYLYCAHPGTEYAERAEAWGLDIVDGVEDMQESGGFPAHRTPHLNQSQVFTAYLMSQLVISEVLAARSAYGPDPNPGTPSRTELRRLFAKLEH